MTEYGTLYLLLGIGAIMGFSVWPVVWRFLSLPKNAKGGL